MIISEKCNCCIHEPVCGFKDEYLAARDAIKNAVYLTGKNKDFVKHMNDSSVSVSIKCPHIMSRSNVR